MQKLHQRDYALWARSVFYLTIVRWIHDHNGSRSKPFTSEHRTIALRIYPQYGFFDSFVSRCHMVCIGVDQRIGINHHPHMAFPEDEITPLQLPCEIMP